MGKKRNIFTHMMAQAAIGPEVLPGQPILEIAGEHRVLIENHQGVVSYGKERIVVNVSFGSVCICGCNLQMMHMTKERLVIYGRIDTVGLQRRR